MEALIDLKKLGALLTPLNYHLDNSQDKPFFWKRIKQNNLRSAYAFTIVSITLDKYTVFIEGLNEPRIKKAIDAGLIEIKCPEDFEKLKEIVFESELEDFKKLEMILPFFEQQLNTITQQAIESDEYQKALTNIGLLVDAANEVEV